jgi:hypothetical protein
VTLKGDQHQVRRQDDFVQGPPSSLARMWPDCRGRHKPCQLLLPPDRRGLPERVQVTALEGETAARKTVISSFASWTGEACSPLARTNQEMHYGIGHVNRYSVSMPGLDSWRSMPRLSHAAGPSQSSK